MLPAFGSVVDRVPTTVPAAEFSFTEVAERLMSVGGWLSETKLIVSVAVLLVDPLPWVLIAMAVTVTEGSPMCAAVLA